MPPRAAVLTCLSLLGTALTACGSTPTLERSTDNVLVTIEDSRIRESRGLALSPRHEGVFLTHNDAGHEPLVFAVGADGETEATFDLAGAPAIDWEDIAVSQDGTVWVGDIGGNADGRESVTVVTFRLPDELTDSSPPWKAYELTYTDGSHNAEALLVRPDTERVYVVTKAREGTAGMYVAPRELDESGPNRLRRLTYIVPASITAGAFAPDGSDRLALRNYARAYVYDRPGAQPLIVELPDVPKGESLTLLDDGDLAVGSEGARSQVLRVRVSAPPTP